MIIIKIDDNLSEDEIKRITHVGLNYNYGGNFSGWTYTKGFSINSQLEPLDEQIFTKEEILKEKIKPPFGMPIAEKMIYEAMEEYAQQQVNQLELLITQKIAVEKKLCSKRFLCAKNGHVKCPDNVICPL